MTCSHSCPFRRGESLHALVWGEPILSFIIGSHHSCAEHWGGEGRSHWFNSSLLGVALAQATIVSAGDAVMNKTRNPLPSWSLHSGGREMKRPSRSLPSPSSGSGSLQGPCHLSVLLTVLLVPRRVHSATARPLLAERSAYWAPARESGGCAVPLQPGRGPHRLRWLRA